MKKVFLGLGILGILVYTVFLFGDEFTPQKPGDLGTFMPSIQTDAAVNYDSSPDEDIIIPEVIWAAATGGGTWVSELHITDMSGGTQVDAWFYYGSGYRHVTLWNSPGLWRSVKYSNILATMASIDTSFTYYGRVGALWLTTQDSSHNITASVRTINGNYGKTYPGLQWIDANTANVNRRMVIHNITNNATYRTFVGIFNCSSGGWEITCEFRLIGPNNNAIGSFFTKTFSAWEFQSFNPFVEAGVGGSYYDNVWLYINPTSTTDPSPERGLMCFGSTANNYTNDTAAHIAVQFQ